MKPLRSRYFGAVPASCWQFQCQENDRRLKHNNRTRNRDSIILLLCMERTDDVFHFSDGPTCRQCGAGMQLARCEYAGSFSRRVFNCQVCGGSMICGRQNLNETQEAFSYRIETQEAFS